MARRRLRTNKHGQFSREEPNGAARRARILARAQAIFVDPQLALRWMAVAPYRRVPESLRFLTARLEAVPFHEIPDGSCAT